MKIKTVNSQNNLIELRIYDNIHSERSGYQEIVFTREEALRVAERLLHEANRLFHYNNPLLVPYKARYRSLGDL